MARQPAASEGCSRFTPSAPQGRLRAAPISSGSPPPCRAWATDEPRSTRSSSAGAVAGPCRPTLSLGISKAYEAHQSRWMLPGESRGPLWQFSTVQRQAGRCATCMVFDPTLWRCAATLPSARLSVLLSTLGPSRSEAAIKSTRRCHWSRLIWRRLATSAAGIHGHGRRGEPRGQAREARQARQVSAVTTAEAMRSPASRGGSHSLLVSCVPSVPSKAGGPLWMSWVLI
jgi:hypothetical protein